MTPEELDKILAKGETETVEFKSWIKAKSERERISLAVDELIALANAKGGTVYMGVEDDGTITGCSKYDTQKILEAVYDRTRPPLFAQVEVINHPDGEVLALHVQSDGVVYATTDGRCLKRLGKNSKPYYPEEMSHRYSIDQIPDFSGQILPESTIEDIDQVEVYRLKQQLKNRDPESTLSEMEDIPFLKDLGLVKGNGQSFQLTVAGLLFVGKTAAINRFLPQAEVIYLHYSANNLEEYDARMDLKAPILTIINRLSEKMEDSNKLLNVQIGLFRMEIADYSPKVFQEALLNAISHRDYQSNGAIYVKHYPDHLIIENPGGLLQGITAENIITHPSLPRNKLIAETLQRLKYVQRTGQGVDIIFKDTLAVGKPYPRYKIYSDAVSLTLYSDVEDMDFVKFLMAEQNQLQRNMSLAELMVLRDLQENKRVSLSHVAFLIQDSREYALRTCHRLIQDGLIEISGKEYMLTAKVYEAMKKTVEYTRDRTIQYIKAKEMILEYMGEKASITNEQTRELCGFTKQQARSTLDKMRKEKLIALTGAGRASRYIRMREKGLSEKKQ